MLSLQRAQKTFQMLLLSQKNIRKITQNTPALLIEKKAFFSQKESTLTLITR
jgi:hypothetical protein